MDRKKIIGQRIRTMRLSHRMTQADLAKAIDQSQASITMYENGRREPDFETLEALADVFNVPLAYLISDDPSSFYPEIAHTKEARIISGGIDRMSPERREQALKILQIAFTEFADMIKEEDDDDT